MGDVRDPGRDQPLPKPGGLPVQEIMIGVIRERREYGRRKYGRPLETNNGRDALKDAWEEALDLFTYLTQMRLERGDVLPGMHEMDTVAELEEKLRRESMQVKAIQRKRFLDGVISSACKICTHEPHRPGECRADAPSGVINCQCGAELLVEQVLGETEPQHPTCPKCSHAVHESFCGVTAGINCCGCPGVYIPI
jgi:hypothetical protein